jgi:hypothetical protein
MTSRTGRIRTILHIKPSLENRMLRSRTGNHADVRALIFLN